MLKAAYAAQVSTFLSAVRNNRWVTDMKKGFLKNFGWLPGMGETRSWQANCPHIERIVETLDPTVLIAFEVSDPVVRGRTDVALMGKGCDGRDAIVILELKQWSNASSVESSPRLVMANTHHGVVEETNHPSAQAKSYGDRFLHWVEECDTDSSRAIDVSTFALVYNMNPEGTEQLRRSQYRDILDIAPLITIRDIDQLVAALSQRVGTGDGKRVFQRIHDSEIRPSRPFAEQAVGVLERRSLFPLIPEQILVAGVIDKALVEATTAQRKTTIIVEGGPGTGKTAIALQCVASALDRGLTPRYVVKSAAMKTTIGNALTDTLDPLISYTDRFGYLQANELDLVVVDEAHRLNRISVLDWSAGTRRQKTKEEMKHALPQGQELVRAARVSVFFIDERQIIQPGESTRVRCIRHAAEAEQAEVRCFSLEVQHRLAGSVDFLEWVDQILGTTIPELPQAFPNTGPFEFTILDSPEALVEAHEKWRRRTPNQSRLITGWCWNWSQKPNADGTLPEEVIVIDDQGRTRISMPWEAPKRGKPGRLAPGIKRGEFWATDPSGEGSFGCVYTAQGFDIPTIALLWPCDLLWRNDRWVGNPKRDDIKPANRGGHPLYDNVDKELSKLGSEDVVQFLRNVYRILMTRATARLYVAFMDEETEELFGNLAGQ